MGRRGHEEGAELKRRTYNEWCDYIHYFPGAFDGKFSIVDDELRQDLAAIVQLLLLVVESTKARLPFTAAEYQKTWTQAFGQIYQHADNLARLTCNDDAADSDSDDGDCVEVQGEPPAPDDVLAWNDPLGTDGHRGLLLAMQAKLLDLMRSISLRR